MALFKKLSQIFGGHSDPAPSAPPPVEEIRLDQNLSEEQNIANIQRALGTGANINSKEWARQSPLCVAAALGMEKVAAFLLDHGADLNPKGEQTPFMSAAATFRPDMMKFLVDRGADPKQPDSIPQDAMTKFLLGADWQHKDEPDFKERDRACMQFLLDRGLTPPDWAKRKAYTEREGLRSFFPDLGDVKKMEEAAKNGDIATVRQMVADGMHPDEPGRCGGISPLDYAIRKDNVTQVRFLLYRGADVELESGDMTPIMRAAKEGARGAFIELLRAGADTTKLFTSDRFPDTTVLELAEQCKKDPGMKDFAEDMIAQRDNLPPPPAEPEPEVATERKISIGHSLHLKLKPSAT